MNGFRKNQKAEIKRHFSRRSVTYFHDNYVGQASSSKQFISRKKLFLETIESHYDVGELILDLGCGPGVMAEDALDHQWKYIGLDLSFENLIKVNGSLIRINGDMENLPFKDGLFAFILAMGSIEYVMDWRRCIREIMRVVKPGGFILISLPNKYSPYRWWAEFFYNPFSSVLKRILGMNVYQYKRKLFSKKQFIDAFGAMINDRSVRFINSKIVFQPFDRLLGKFDLKISEKIDSKNSFLTSLFSTEIFIVLQRH